MFSSSWRKAFSWLGSLISIFASISVFLISSAASSSAIFGSTTRVGSVGWLYQNGFGVTQDYGKAMIWYRKAATQGDAKAPANIGWL